VAGIYIHIPFCKQACTYCNFHFSTSLELKTHFLEALIQELDIQKNYLSLDGKKAMIKSVYFGGGTPSLLTQQELQQIFDALYTHYNISPDAEITLEANPDDLTKIKLKALKDSPINRLSIGIQSFVEADLRFMNRAHTANEAVDSIVMAQDLGFQNLTIDLIYGTPTLSTRNWEGNLEKIFSLGIPHLSCYCLTVEEKTALAHLVKVNSDLAVDEEKAIEQFELLLERTRSNDYVQYEISNFCKNEHYSLHNSNYWKKENYLGLGPSAHSYDGVSRQWNVANNRQYVDALKTNKVPFEREVLSPAQQYNEYILTTLRTHWGTDLEKVNTAFGPETLKHLQDEMQGFIKEGTLFQKDSFIFLTDGGKLLADKITASLFL
jgi:oxygen-independent coproporphyrinogen-3 oxidase